MRILRIEADGVGMYMGKTREAGVYMNEDRAHPLPHEDSGMSMEALIWLDDNGYGGTGRARFGFTSVAQLRRWLYQDEWLIRLDSVGCELVEYEASVAYAGHTQAMFDIDASTVVSKKPLVSLLNEGSKDGN